MSEATVEAIDAVLQVASKIVEDILDDNPKRERFTQEFVQKAREQFPDYNVVIIHPKHNRDGNFIHQHYELSISFGRTIGYEVYFSKIGDPFTLDNLGDGGYINWAFIGYNRNGNHISS